MFNKEKYKLSRKKAIHNRVRAKISGTSSIPRLSVFRSNKGMYLQLIDDENSKTMTSANMKEIKSKKGMTKIDIGTELGKIIAEKALKINIKRIVFDKGSYRYHGRVKAVAESARNSGLQF